MFGLGSRQLIINPHCGFFFAKNAALIGVFGHLGA